jgi:hypothetical protein
MRYKWKKCFLTCSKYTPEFMTAFYLGIGSRYAQITKYGEELLIILGKQSPG